MKKTIILVSAIFLFAGMTFAQTPQTPVEGKPITKTEVATPAKDTKAGCDKKDMEKCSKSKSSKSCCAHEAKKPAETKAPEKK
jgi:hypothetical protein